MVQNEDKWLMCVETELNNLGLYHIWNLPQVDGSLYTTIIKERMCDIFKQKCYE